MKDDYPIFIDEKGKPHKCIGYACGMPKIYWEWYLFDKETDDIYFAYVMGFDNEWGSVSVQELKDNGIYPTFNKETLHTIAPPINWTKRSDNDGTVKSK